MHHPTVMRQKRKRGHGEKTFLLYWAGSFRVEYNKKKLKDSSAPLPVHSTSCHSSHPCFLSAVLSCPALAHWPRLTSEKVFGKTVFEGFFRANLIYCRELLLATGWRCMRMEAESCSECQKCLFQGRQSRGFISTIFFTRRCPLA